MIPILISVMVMVFSLMVAFFLAVGNVSTLVESDFMYKAKNNAVLHGLQYGQLAKRANVLKTPSSDTHPSSVSVEAGYLRVDRDPASGKVKERNKMMYNITLNSTGYINNDVEVK